MIPALVLAATLTHSQAISDWRARVWAATGPAQVQAVGTLTWTNPACLADTLSPCALTYTEFCHAGPDLARPLLDLASVEVWSVNPGRVPAPYTFADMLASDSLWAALWPAVAADAQPKLYATLVRVPGMVGKRDSLTGVPSGFYFVVAKRASGRRPCASNIVGVP
jgi:hypothetical protein